MKKLGLLFCVAMFSTNAAVAQQEMKGDPEAGKAKSTACAACHSVDGNSVIDMNPKLAGQHAGYLVKQLQDFRTASQTGGAEGRNNAVMNGFAAGLSDQDMLDIAAYFASQDMKPGSTPEDMIDAGAALYRGGDAERGITACIACHGPKGNGMGLAGFPDISGQHVTYTKTQLENFRSGARANDLNGMMRDIAKKLTDEDIQLLSNYVSGLH